MVSVLSTASTYTCSNGDGDRIGHTSTTQYACSSNSGEHAHVGSITDTNQHSYKYGPCTVRYTHPHGYARVNLYHHGETTLARGTRHPYTDETDVLHIYTQIRSNFASVLLRGLWRVND